jgi:bla regulator protein BlaR1
MTSAYVLNHLWQSTLFAAAAGLLTVALRKNRAPVRYWLWFAASAKFLVPFSLLLTIGNQVEWRRAPAAAPIALFPVMDRISQPFAPPVLPPLLANVPPASSNAPTVLFCVWLCGFSVVAFAWARQWRRIRTAIRAASPLHLNLPIPVLSSPARLEPGVFGILRTVLLVPEGITERLTPAQWEAILAHELCHVRRRDNLTAAIHMAVEAIFWFHPLVWWVGKRLVDERERACDEEVLLAATDPRDYAEAILNVCKLYVESSLECVSGVTGSSLKKRIQAIMAVRVAGELNFAKKLALALAGIAALGAPIVVGIMNAPPLRAQSAPAATPKFEVASIRPCRPGDQPAGGGRGGRGGGGGSSFGRSPGRISVTCMTVFQLINAYLSNDDPLVNDSAGLFDIKRVRGGPAWVHSARYTIEAETNDPVATGPTTIGSPASKLLQGPMLRTLLEDRFQLKTHREIEEIPMYALTVAKGGFKLKPMEEGGCIPRDPTKGVLVSQMFPPGQKPLCVSHVSWDGPNWTIDAAGQSLDRLAGALSVTMDRHVLDKTGIAGLFNFHLAFAHDGDAPGNLPPDLPSPFTASDIPPGPSVFTVLQQLGLKLAPVKGPRGYIVIDRVERPSEN